MSTSSSISFNKRVPAEELRKKKKRKKKSESFGGWKLKLDARKFSLGINSLAFSSSLYLSPQSESSTIGAHRVPVGTWIETLEEWRAAAGAEAAADEEEMQRKANRKWNFLSSSSSSSSLPDKFYLHSETTLQIQIHTLLSSLPMTDEMSSLSSESGDG